jgi:tripartite-type tricarboxylate transporter receptor subunit TctC
MMFLLVLVLGLTSLVAASDYPKKPIQIIVPVPAGGTCDTIARILAPKLTSILGQQVIVVNKPGGGGATASKLFASSTEPDGYTILTNHVGILLFPILKPEIGFKLEDFTPICQATCQARAIVVKAGAPWRTLEDFIQDAKKNPGKFTYSTGGFGSGYHFDSELFKIETGIDIVHVPMEGDALAITALLGGHVDLTVTGMGGLSAHLKAGTLRALAVLSPSRIKDRPDIPTVKELGYNVTSMGWFGYFLPAKAPKEITEKLGKAFDIALKDKEVVDKVEKTGMVIGGLILEEATRFFQAEDKKWRQVAQKAKMVDEGRK